MNGPGVLRSEHEVPSDGYRLWVRLVRPARPLSSTFVLFVHGLTFPSVADFDLPVEGASLCGYLAVHGINCCIFDLRGYGRSDKPEYGQPIGMAERARDLHAVWQWLETTQGATGISLAGLSSGCNTIAECFKSSGISPQSVLMVAPCYLLNPAMRHCLRRARFLRVMAALIGKPRAVYACLGRGLLASRLYAGEEELIDRQTFETFVSHAIEITCPGRRCLRAPVLRYPEVRGISRLWTPLFDAGAIRSPLLVIRGDGDEFCCGRSAEALIAGTQTLSRRLVTLAGRKHDIHLYKKHDDYFEETLRFLTPAT